MEFIGALWLPIILSAVAVFIASALAWMLVGHHSKDHQGLGEERERKLIEALKSINIAPGVYGFPDMHKAMSRDEQRKMFDTMFQNPVGLLRVWRHPNMGVNMFMSFVIYLVASTLIAYLGWAAFGHAKVEFTKIFQVLGTAGVLTYTIASLPGDVWFQNSKRAMVLNVLDGVVFGLITGAIFAWRWPG